MIPDANNLLCITDPMWVTVNRTYAVQLSIRPEDGESGLKPTPLDDNLPGSRGPHCVSMTISFLLLHNIAMRVPIT